MKCAVNDTITYIKLLAQDIAGCDPNCAVLAILFDLRIPVNHHGFQYLKTAILLQYQNPMLIVLNEIYQEIAEMYGDVSEDIIAASIHRVIKAAWERGDLTLWETYLPAANVNKNGPPTNSEVIAGLARIVELWQGCSDAYLRQLNREVVSSERK